jgi:hypothetical protein
LRSGRLVLALLLSDLVFEPLLLDNRRLPDLFELLLKINDPLLLRRRILQEVSPALGATAKDCQQTNNLVNNTSANTSSKSTSSETYRQCMVVGHNAGPQALHILIAIKDIILPRSVI